MVDFQRRDTKRGPVDDEDEEEASGESEAAEGPDAAAAADADGADDASADDERVERTDGAEPDADAAGADGGATGGAGGRGAGEPGREPSDEEPSVDADEVEAAIAAREETRGDGPSDAASDTAASGTAASDTDAGRAGGTAPADDASTAGDSPPSGAADEATRRTAADGSRPVGDRGPSAGQSDAADGRPGTTDATDGPSRTVSAAVITISVDRTHESDPGGEAIESALEAAGHEVAGREVLRPTYDTVQQAVDALVDREDVEAIVTNGGTGVTPEDVTVEAVNPLFEKALPGFGELFRSLYYERAGTDVAIDRATAGIADGTPVFCLPGDPDGAELATREIVAEQAPAIVGALEDGGPSDP